MEVTEITLATSFAFALEAEHLDVAKAKKLAKRWERRFEVLQTDGTVNIVRDGAERSVLVECDLTVAQAFTLVRAGVNIGIADRLEDEYPTLRGGARDLAVRIEELRDKIDSKASALVALAV